MAAYHLWSKAVQKLFARSGERIEAGIPERHILDRRVQLMDGIFGSGSGAALAGFSATLVGIGLARFAYGPLLTALVSEGWFDVVDAGYLGAANFAGYCAGAFVAARLAALASTRALLRGSMLAAALSFIACAVPAPFALYCMWRFLSGFSGALLMVLAAPAVLAVVPVQRRGRVAGIVFSGVGVGIVTSALLVPLLLRLGLQEAWLVLGGVSLLLTLLVWSNWPIERPRAVAASPVRSRQQGLPVQLAGLSLAYALVAVALVPHFVFLVDFVARGLGHGIHAGAQAWALFGAGALGGPLGAGYVADQFGFARALRLALLAGSGAIAVPAVLETPLPIAISCFLVGALTTGIVPLVLGRTQETTSRDDHRRAWGLCTTAFALGQVTSGYGFSYLFQASGRAYGLLFTVAASALLIALAVEIASTFLSGVLPPHRPRGKGEEA